MLASFCSSIRRFISLRRWLAGPGMGFPSPPPLPSCHLAPPGWPRPASLRSLMRRQQQAGPGLGHVPACLCRVNTSRRTAIAFRGSAGSRLANLTTFSLLAQAVLLLRSALWDGQDRDLRLRIRCRLRILHPAVVAVGTK
jgi:hypothetical protein